MAIPPRSLLFSLYVLQLLREFGTEAVGMCEDGGRGEREERGERAKMRNMILILLPLLLISSTTVDAFNITRILAEHPQFSTFNHYLTETHLASEINRRQTITVLAIDNSAMSALLARHFTIPTLKNVLSLHLLVDYYGAKKLHQLTGGTSLSSSFFQSTGSAPGTTGFVNITDHSKGHVTFAAEDDSGTPSTSPASFVKSIKELPYNLSVVQISSPLSNPAAEAPASAPAPVNLTSVLSANGCKLFSSLLSSIPDVLSTFDTSLDGGLTVFCPVDGAVKSFAPKYKNLTAAQKSSLLLFHGQAVYSSMQMLKQGNALSSTLASEGTKKSYHLTVQNDGDGAVSLDTKVNTAKIMKTVLDQDPVSIFSIDRVLEPKELFKAADEAPAPAAEAPKSAKKKKAKKGTPSAPAPAGPEESPADDQKAADENAAPGKDRWAAAVFAAAIAAAVAIA